MEPELLVDGLTVRFGGIVALDGVSFAVERSTICGLIGSNGAGKTTCFNCISGVYRPQSGRIMFEGDDLLRLPRHAIAARGVGRTFQNLALFPGLSVLRNVMIGGHTTSEGNFLTSVIGTRAVARSEEALRERSVGLLERFDLSATGESIACLNCLLLRDEIDVREDADGVAWYRLH